MTKFKSFSDISKFNPDTTRYSAANALVLADAARLAYEGKAMAESVAKNDWKLRVGLKMFTIWIKPLRCAA